MTHCRALVGVCLLVILAACGSDGGAAGAGPLVRLHLSAVDPTTVHATLAVTGPDASGNPQTGMTDFASGPFDVLGVSFSPGARGATSYQISLYSDGDCLLGTGTAMMSLQSDGEYDLAVTITPVALCGKGATLTVQVANIFGASGTVVSTPSGISCSGSGQGCSATLMKGSVTLHANALVGAFGGWTGATCSGVGDCTLDLQGDTQVQAVFTSCHGWCKEPLPFQVTANLNGISGTAANNIIVAGDNGTVLRWDGSSWTQQQTPATGTTSLRAVFGRSGGSAVWVAGDLGTVLQYASGAWTQIGNTSTATLRAIAAGAGSSPSTYFVGDSGTLLQLSPGGTSVAGKNANTSLSLYAISQNPGNNNTDLFMGGALSGTTGFAQAWDGNNSYTSNSPKIPSSINAMACGGAYHYAVGDAGAVSRRSSAGGNSTNWSLTTSAGGTSKNLRGLWLQADNNIYAVGDGGTMLHFDGSAWSTVQLTNLGTFTTTLRAVWGTSATNMYAVGDGGTILRYLQ